MFVATCSELDVASQGETIEEAFANLQEAVELYLEELSLRDSTQSMSRQSLNTFSNNFIFKPNT